jgi:hypothetical protein
VECLRWGGRQQNCTVSRRTNTMPSIPLRPRALPHSPSLSLFPLTPTTLFSVMHKTRSWRFALAALPFSLRPSDGPFLLKGEHRGMVSPLVSWMCVIVSVSHLRIRIAGEGQQIPHQHHALRHALRKATSNSNNSTRCQMCAVGTPFSLSCTRGLRFSKCPPRRAISRSRSRPVLLSDSALGTDLDSASPALSALGRTRGYV